MGFLNKIPKFLNEVKVEARRVNWPTRRETLRHTLIVVGAFILIAIILGGFDLLFTKILNRFIIKLP